MADFMKFSYSWILHTLRLFDLDEIRDSLSSWNTLIEVQDQTIGISASGGTSDKKKELREIVRVNVMSIVGGAGQGMSGEEGRLNLAKCQNPK